MPRAPRQKRQATEADLDSKQRAIYDALPDHLKQQYLNGLPAITVSSAGRKRKAQLIRDRIGLLDDIIAGLQDQKRHLNSLARGLDKGEISPDTIDLRQELKPPDISGVSMRYERRGKRGSE